MSTEQDVRKLHELFGQLSGRVEPLRFSESSWRLIFQSPEYNFDAAKIEADMRVLVSYLRVQIGLEKRNMGALKLRNFLQPDTWFADLAEAQAWQKTRRNACAARPAQAPAPTAGQKPLVSEEDYDAAAKRLAAMKAELAGGPRK